MIWPACAENLIGQAFLASPASQPPHSTAARSCGVAFLSGFRSGLGRPLGTTNAVAGPGYRPSGVARFPDEHYSDATIPIGQWHGHPIVMQLADPGRVGMTNDRDFFEILDDPVGRVDLFAVAKFDGVSPHVIESAYPGIWQLGRSWLELEAEVGRATALANFPVRPAP